MRIVQRLKQYIPRGWARLNLCLSCVVSVPVLLVFTTMLIFSIPEYIKYIPYLANKHKVIDSSRKPPYSYTTPPLIVVDNGKVRLIDVPSPMLSLSEIWKWLTAITALFTVPYVALSVMTAASVWVYRGFKGNEG